MKDLLCVIPLYGANCEEVSLRMVSSLSLQKTKYDVKYLFLYDDTVSKEALLNVHFLLLKKNYELIYSENSHSGVKRNLGIKYASDHNYKYIWFIDQDDYILREDIFDGILDYCFKNNSPVIKVDFTIPDTVGEFNSKALRTTVTMPWLYVLRVDLVKDFRFNEKNEYGSDVPFIIRFLALNGYISINEDSSLNLLKKVPSTNIALYYYNYLNDNSHMGKHFKMSDDKRKSEIAYATTEIQKIRKECMGILE